MNRQQLEHVIEEVGRRTGLEYFYIIGASAVLAVLPEPSEAALVQTRDVDIVPGTADASEEDRIANQIDWVLGEGSEFEIEHHYYAQGLPPKALTSSIGVPGLRNAGDHLRVRLLEVATNHPGHAA